MDQNFCRSACFSWWWRQGCWIWSKRSKKRWLLLRQSLILSSTSHCCGCNKATLQRGWNLKEASPLWFLVDFIRHYVWNLLTFCCNACDWLENGYPNLQPRLNATLTRTCLQLLFVHHLNLIKSSHYLIVAITVLLR